MPSIAILGDGARLRASILLALQTLLALLVDILVELVLLAWGILVLPAQYVVFLVAGSPSRNAMNPSPGRLPVRTIMRVDGSWKTISIVRLDAPLEEGWEEVGFGARPVTLTLATTALILWFLDQIV
jgi:hypothetical protein